MFILGFETTGNIGTCGLLDLESPDNNKMIKSTDEPMSHLRLMGSLAEELLRESGIDDPSAELAGVAASIGPGSFTGIRIGVTIARAMSQALGIPAISVPTLEEFREFADGEMPVAAILNARRGQVYGAVYDKDGSDLLPPGPYMLTDVLKISDRYPMVRFYGDGIDAYWDILSQGDKAEAREFAPLEDRYQNAKLVLDIAKRKFEQGDVLGFDELMPDYMRLAEAEQKLRDGVL